MKTLRILSIALMFAAVVILSAMYYQQNYQVKVLHSESRTNHSRVIETKSGQVMMQVEEHHSVLTPMQGGQQARPQSQGMLH